jgi:hypothetical protein
MQGDADQAVTLLERSAAMAAEEGFTWWQAIVLDNLADLALARNRLEEAATRARQTLHLSRQIGDRQLSVCALAYLACVAAEDGEREGRELPLQAAIEEALGHSSGTRIKLI